MMPDGRSWCTGGTIAWVVAIALSCDPAADPEPDPVDAQSAISTEWTSPRCEAQPLPCPCRDPTIDFAVDLLSFGDPAVSAIEMVHGPQGGWHLQVAVRAENTLDVVRLAIEVTDAETSAILSREQPRHKLVPDGDCAGIVRDVRLFLTHAALVDDAAAVTLPRALSCRTIDVAACVTDKSGREACLSRPLQLLPDPADVTAGLVARCEHD